MLISQETLTRVRDSADIVEVIGEYVPNLKKAGKDFKGLCPFHQERTPSFMVSPSKGIFHCFGCNQGGDVIKFVMEMDRCTYPEAIQKLADKKGIQVQFTGQSNPEFSKERERRKKLLAILKRAAQFYHRKLMDSADAEPARKYLMEKRKLTAETIEKFQIGWASGMGANSLIAAAKSSGVTEQDLKDAGLAVRSQSSGRVVECFRSRIMFPIFDLKGDIVAFGGRILETGAGRVPPKGDFVPPKYINSPESEVYHKSRNLFGFYQGAKAIRDSEEVIVVEGYMDVIGCHQAGVENVVAPLGTALTEEQGQILRRYVKEVILLFDADAAGERAAQRGAEVLLEQGFFPTVANLPSGKDSDEFLLTHSKDEFLNMIKRRISFVEFKLDVLSAQNQDAPVFVKKAMLIQAVLPLIAKVENEVLKREMLKLVSHRLKVSEESLYNEFKKVKPAAARKSYSAPEKGPRSERPAVPGEKPLILGGQKKNRTLLGAEEELLCLALLNADVRARIISVLQESGPVLDEHLREALSILSKHPGAAHHQILDAAPDAYRKWLGGLIVQFQQIVDLQRSASQNPEGELEGLILRLELKKIEKRLDEIRKMAKTPALLRENQICVQRKTQIEKTMQV